MNTQDAVKMIELCLNSVNDDIELQHLMNLVINRRIELATPRKRTYIKREAAEA